MITILKRNLKRFIPNSLIRLSQKYYLNKQRKKFRRNCKELLELTDALLRKEEITYWLNYGTLLGAYRDKDFIAHDYDLDIGLYWSDYKKVKELMLNAGMSLKFEARFANWDNPECVEYRFEYKGVFIDLNFYKINGNIATTYDFITIDGVDSVIGEKLPVLTESIDNPFYGLKEFNFLGKKYNIPENIEEYLVANYGENFMTPVKDFDYHNFAKNIHSYSLEEIHSNIIIYY